MTLEIWTWILNFYKKNSSQITAISDCACKTKFMLLFLFYEVQSDDVWYIVPLLFFKLGIEKILFYFIYFDDVYW